MTITKADLMNAVYEKTELQRHKSVLAVESLTELIKHTLESAEDVLMSGFGKFSVKEKKERRGRNPQTGKDAVLRERRVVTFKTSPVLREKINSTKL